MPRAHARHRYRVISRCLACAVPLLGACSYRTCAETTLYHRPHRATCQYRAYEPSRRPRTRRQFDAVAAARRIFGDMLDTPLPLGSNE